ncbi:glycogen synthase GlgA [bacterium]|nr:glycogen synthase GlgA [bacterium]
MNILMVSAEAFPFSKTGGLGDVVGSLSQALAQSGEQVTVLLPYWPAGHAGPPPARLATGLNTSFPGDPAEFGIRVDRPHEGLTYLLIDAPNLFDRAGLYGDETGRAYLDNVARFTFFGRAVLKVIDHCSLPTDVLHLHDWHAGLLPWQRRFSSGSKTVAPVGIVQTIHNIAYQGRFAADDWKWTGLPRSAFSLEGIEFWGDWSMLKAGILAADQITTVSPTYAQELLGADQGKGFEGILASRQARLTGIINGIDRDKWNPASDSHLECRYDLATVGVGKAACKRRLQLDWGLPARHDVPLIGMVGRLTEQKGIDALLLFAKHLLNRETQFAILGQGDRNLEELVTQLAECYPDRVRAKIGFHESEARRIYAAADGFFMPSRFEPCGLSQLLAMRYGAIPIVHAVGGLIDTVVDATPSTIERRTATGFHFHRWSEEALIGVFARVEEAFRSRLVWDGLIASAMQADWSWAKSVPQYQRVYGQACRFAQRAGS